MINITPNKIDKKLKTTNIVHCTGLSRAIQIRRKDFSFRSILFVSLDFNVPQWVGINSEEAFIKKLIILAALHLEKILLSNSNLLEAMFGSTLTLHWYTISLYFQSSHEL